MEPQDIDETPQEKAEPEERVAQFPKSRRKARHDGWTRPKMSAFLRELAASQSVTQAAQSVGMSRKSAYALRNRLAGTPFSLGWEVALESGLHQLAHAVMERALNGEEVPHYYRGELVGTSRRYDNRLASWVLANPWRVGRLQAAREYGAERWDSLLEQIETGPLDWPPNPEEEGLSPDPLRSSWYADDAELQNKRRGRFGH